MHWLKKDFQCWRMHYCCSTCVQVCLQGHSGKPSKHDRLKSDLRVLILVKEGVGILDGLHAIGLLMAFVLCVVAIHVLLRLHRVGTLLIKH